MMNGQAFSGCLSRRRFTFGLAAPLALALIGLPARQAEAARRERSLLLHHLHTGETLKAVYFADGRYLKEGLRAITHHLRDWRVDQTRPIDPELLDLVWAVWQRLESSAPVHVVCGYRSPATNALLRRRSHGVARNSLHLRGMAIDLRVPDRSLRTLRSAALSLKGGGVGYYPRSDFVHVDSGSVRSW
jgi:uncharacterized protein YcbK (DUF882 family)